MTTHELPIHDEATTTRPSAWRAGVVTAALAAAANLLLYVLARLTGTDFTVATGGREPMEIGPLLVVVNVVAATLVGTLLLATTARRSDRAWRVLAWTGLAFGVLSMVAPLTASGSAGAKLVLAGMHLSTGIVWYSVVTRSVRNHTS